MVSSLTAFLLSSLPFGRQSASQRSLPGGFALSALAGPFIVLSLAKTASKPGGVREPDLPYSTEIFWVGKFHPHRGKLSPIFKSGFRRAPGSVASPGDSIGEFPIDFTSPWLTKILEENFWSQENVPDHRDSGRTGNSSLKILIRLGALTPEFPKPPPGGLARGHDLWPLTYHIPCAKSSFAHFPPEACICRRLAIPRHFLVDPLHNMYNLHVSRRLE